MQVSVCVVCAKGDSVSTMGCQVHGRSMSSLSLGCVDLSPVCVECQGVLLVEGEVCLWSKQLHGFRIGCGKRCLCTLGEGRLVCGSCCDYHASAFLCVVWSRYVLTNTC